MNTTYTKLTDAIAKGRIANALTSTAKDHVLGVAKDIYDEDLQGYQSEINSALTESTEDLQTRLSGFTFFESDEYIFAIADLTGSLLFGIRNDGDVVYNTGMSDEVRGRLNELDGIQILQSDQYIYAIIDAVGNILFGIKSDGTVVAPINEFDSKIERAQKTAASAIGMIYDLSGSTSESIDELANETEMLDEGLSSLSAYTENISAVTNNISALTETLSGVSDETVDRLHDLDGIQLTDAGFLFGMADSEGYEVFKIDNSGKTFVGNGIVVYGEKAGLDVMDVDAFQFAVTDSEDKVLFGLSNEGSAYINKSLTFYDLGGKFEIIEDSPEWAYAITDAEGSIVFGISTAGEVYIPKGTSEDVKARFSELENIKVLDNTGSFLFAITDQDGNVPFGIQPDGSTFIAKGMPEDVKERMSELDGIHLMSNSEYVFAIADADDKLLFALDYSGNTVMNGINGFAKAESVEDDNFIYCIRDGKGTELFGILKDGTVWVNKFNSGSDGTAGSNSGLDDLDDEEFIYIITDKDGKIVFGVTFDGTTYIPKGMSEDTKAEFKKVNRTLNDINNELESINNRINDWSDEESITLPIPRVAARIDITGNIPPNKYTDVLGTITYNDVDGNTFTKPIMWSRQGNISSGFDKPNFSIDLLANLDADDEGAYTEFTVQFGDWPAQDGYHLKAYYSDFWKIRSIGSYHHQMDITAARDEWNKYPWDRYKFLASQQTSGRTGTAVNGGIGALEEDMRTGAMGHPDGFPVMLYINNMPYGLYTWNLKKNRKNYMIEKNDSTGNEILFGDMLYGFFTMNNYGYWNLVNAFLNPVVVSEGTSSRTAYSPEYAGSTLLTIFDKAAADDNGITLSISNLSGSVVTKPVYYNGSAVTTNNTWEDGEMVNITVDSTNDVFNAVKYLSKWTEDKAFASGTTVYDVNVFNFEVSGNTSEVTLYRSFVAQNHFAYDANGYPCYGILNEETGEITPGSHINYINTLKPSYTWWRGCEIRNPKEMLVREYDGLDENGYKKFRYEMYNYDSPSDLSKNPVYEWSHEIVDGKYEFWGSKGETRAGMTNLNGAKMSDGTAIKENLYLRALSARGIIDTYVYASIIQAMALQPKNLFEWGFLSGSTADTYEADFYAMTSSEKKAIRNAARKQIFDEHHDVDFLIDYFIVSQDLYYLDSITHNTIYATYDGKHLVPNIYDMDITMGMNSTYINSFPPVATGLVTGAWGGGVGYMANLWEFYPDEVKARYKKYRDMGVISEDAYYKVVYGVVNSVGFSNYEFENKLWSQPSYRNPVYWKMPAGALKPIYNKSGVFKNWGYDESLNKALPTAKSWSSAETVNVEYTPVIDTIGGQTVYSGITKGIAGATILSSAFVPEQTDKGTDADNTDQTVQATLMCPGVTIPSTMRVLIEGGNITVTQVTDAENTSWEGDPILAPIAPVQLSGIATNIEATSHAAGKKYSFTADLQLRSADGTIIINTKMGASLTGGGKVTPWQNSVSEGSTMSPGSEVFSGVAILSATTEGDVTTVSGRTSVTGTNTSGIALSGVLNMVGTTSNGTCTLNVTRRSGNVNFLDALVINGEMGSTGGDIKGAVASGITYTTGTTVNDGSHYYVCQVQHNASEEFRPSVAYTCGNPGGGVYDSPRRCYEWLVARMGILDGIFGYTPNNITLQGLNDKVDTLSGVVISIQENINNIVERLGGENEGIQILYNTSDYLYAIVDNEGKLLFAIEADGTTYIAKGIPDDVQTEIDKINAKIISYHGE